MTTPGSPPDCSHSPVQSPAVSGPQPVVSGRNPLPDPSHCGPVVVPSPMPEPGFVPPLPTLGAPPALAAPLPSLAPPSLAAPLPSSDAPLPSRAPLAPLPSRAPLPSPSPGESLPLSELEPQAYAPAKRTTDNQESGLRERTSHIPRFLSDDERRRARGVHFGTSRVAQPTVKSSLPAGSET